MEHSDQPLKNSDLATLQELARYLRIDRTTVPDVMATMDVPRRGRGYPWIRIWAAFGIILDAETDRDALKTPLLELKEVAGILEESSKTIRRRSNGEHREKSFPTYVDLGQRKRLFFPSEIEAWFTSLPKPFERKKENLSFIPVRKSGSRTKGKAGKNLKAPRPSPPSAVVAMFIVPPKSS